MNSQLQPMSTTRNLGWMLQSVRKSKRMTQVHIASRVGVSQSRISHLEQHPEELSVQQLFAWCSALNLELAIGPKDALNPNAPPAGPSTVAW